MGSLSMGSLSRESLSRRVSIWGSLSRLAFLCPVGYVQGVSAGFCPGSVHEVSVQRFLSSRVSM